MVIWEHRQMYLVTKLSFEHERIAPHECRPDCEISTLNDDVVRSSREKTIIMIISSTRDELIKSHGGKTSPKLLLYLFRISHLLSWTSCATFLDFRGNWRPSCPTERSFCRPSTKTPPPSRSKGCSTPNSDKNQVSYWRITASSDAWYQAELADQ